MIRLLTGDVRDVLPTLASDSVHCVVTSPPYWNLRDYGTALWDGGDAGCDHTPGVIPVSDDDPGIRCSTLEGGKRTTTAQAEARSYRDICGKCGARRIDRQLGLEPTPDAYIAAMVAVFREVRRVLRPDGTLWLNVGSSYASGGKRPSRSPVSERVPAYDTAYTAPSGSPAPDCAYPGQRGEPQGDLLIHHDRIVGIDPQSPPTSLLDAMTGRDSAHPASLAASPSPHGALASTTLSSSANGQGAFGLEAPASACLAELPRALPASQRFAHMTASPSSSRSCSAVSPDRPSRTHGSELIDGSSASRKADKGAGSVPSCSCGSCGICFAYSVIPMLQFKAKDLMMMPHLLALALQADGWYVRSDITWSKPNPMPESCTDRPTSAHEHVFLLTKRARYYFDADAIAEPAMNTGGGEGATPDKAARAGITSNGTGLSSLRDKGAATRACRNVWTIPTHAYPAAHFATYPPELAERCIKAGTSERGCCAACGAPWVRVTEETAEYAAVKARLRETLGPDFHMKRAGTDAVKGAGTGTNPATLPPKNTTTGWSPSCTHDADVVPCTVLDCFSGAGTTLLVADRLQRHAIGIDLNASYADLARRRIEADAPLFTSWAPAEDPADQRMADLFAEAAE